jgi:pantothenate synthetase
LEVVDIETLRPSRTAVNLAAIVAARIGHTRLIDNIRF